MGALVLSFTCAISGAWATPAVEAVAPDSEITTPEDKFAKLANATAILRGRHFTGPVDWTITDTRTLIETVILPELDLENLEMLQRRLWKLKLLPADTTLKDALLPVLTEQIVGVYVPRTQKMYAIGMGDYLKAAGLPSHAEEPLFDFTLVHELTHALQDQLFDLETFGDHEAIERGELTDDAFAARLALIEGDAMFVSMDFLLGQIPGAAGPGTVATIPAQHLQVLLDTTQGTPEMSTAPPFVADSLIAPYTFGLLFVHALYTTAQWDAVDNAYGAQVPASTEQILHPDRYHAGDQPTVVPDLGLVELLGPAWKQDTPGMFGELDTRLFLRHAVSREIEASASAGWDGDRVELFVHRDDGSRHALIWASVWDTPDDAREFATAAGQFYATHYGTPSASGIWTAPGGEISVERQGHWVLAIDALDPETRAAASKRVWSRIGDMLPQP